MIAIHYGSAEMRAFKASAKHVHVSDGGMIEYWGDGRRVLIVKHRGRAPASAEIVGPTGENHWREPFRYRDYFLAPLQDSEVAT